MSQQDKATMNELTPSQASDFLRVCMRRARPALLRGEAGIGQSGGYEGSTWLGPYPSYAQADAAGRAAALHLGASLAGFEMAEDIATQEVRVSA